MDRSNKQVKLVLLLFIAPLVLWAAATTATSSGNWSNTAIWSGGNIADLVTEDVDFDDNIGTVTIQAGETFTTSNISLKSDNTLTIDATGTLNVGNTGTSFTLSTGDNSIINVDGNLTIWGRLDVGNNLTLNVTGTLTIKEDLVMGNDASLQINGNVDVDGDFSAGNDAAVVVDGDLTVDGSFTAGTGSDMSGSGTATTGGTCAGPDAFCISSPLPVELISFDVTSEDNEIHLTWQTATEINNDYFNIERSEDGEHFYQIGQIMGNGNSSVVNQYTYKDRLFIAPVEYYRLKQVDYDGAYEYFPSKRVETTASLETLKIQVFPTVVEDNNLFIKSNKGFHLRDFVVYNLSGDVSQSVVSITTREDQLTYRATLATHAQGIYVAKVTISTGEEFVFRLIIK